MPTVFRALGYRFFFYSNEGSPREPIHIHIVYGKDEAKFWLDEEVTLARSYGFDAKTLRKLRNIVIERREDIENGWQQHFGK